jgi:CRP-like cAMP-binding protein
VVQRLLKHGSLSLCQENQKLYTAGESAKQVYVVVWGKIEIGEKGVSAFMPVAVI